MSAGDDQAVRPCSNRPTSARGTTRKLRPPGS